MLDQSGWRRAAGLGDPAAEDPGRGLAYRRRFGRPSGLRPNQRVELIVAPSPVAGRAWLNGRLLGELPAGAAAVRFDVRSRLAARNELLVYWGPARPGESIRKGEHGATGPVEVRLEIHSPSGG